MYPVEIRNRQWRSYETTSFWEKAMIYFLPVREACDWETNTCILFKELGDKIIILDHFTKEK